MKPTPQLDLEAELGATAGVSVQCLTVYIPSHDQDGQELGDQRRWVLRAAELLARMGGGVTIMPPVEGGWLKDDGTVIWEDPVLVYTFIKPKPFRKLLPELRELLHSLGRETRQGEVAFEFGERFYRINEFDAQSE